MEGLRAPEHLPRAVEIAEVISETATIKSILFEDRLSSESKPGQFAMVWIPGIDEIPMSYSYIGRSGYSGVTVRAVGEATTALHALKAGQRIGVRGPYGNGFHLNEASRLLVVGGGTGIACLGPLVEQLASLRRELSLVLGARTAVELLFLDRIKRSVSRGNSRIVATTDDGSYGSKGLASEYSVKLLQSGAFEQVYTCGPEPMMAPIVQACVEKSIPVQASLERYIKCGLGLCGSCVIGPYRVCKDGPIFEGKDLIHLDEFGRSKRDASGAKQRF